MAALHCEHHITSSMTRIKANTIRNTRVATQSDSKDSTSKLSLIEYISSGLVRLWSIYSVSSFVNFIQIRLEANDYTDMQV